MRLTLGQIEDIYLHSEELRPIVPATWSLLYYAARNDGIDKLEALRVIRSEPKDVGRFIDAFLVPEDIEEVKKMSFTIGLEMSSPHGAQAVTKRMLDSWVAKTLMREIAQRAHLPKSQNDDAS